MNRETIDACFPKRRRRTRRNIYRTNRSLLEFLTTGQQLNAPLKGLRGLSRPVLRSLESVNVVTVGEFIRWVISNDKVQSQFGSEHEETKVELLAAWLLLVMVRQERAEANLRREETAILAEWSAKRAGLPGFVSERQDGDALQQDMTNSLQPGVSQSAAP